MEICINKYNVCPLVCWSVVLSWLIPEPEVDFNFFTNNETKKSGDIVKELQIQVHQQWNSYLQINANGPKYLKNGTVAFGIYIPEIKVEKGLPILDHMSVFTAEMVTLLRGLWWVED